MALSNRLSVVVIPMQKIEKRLKDGQGEGKELPISLDREFRIFLSVDELSAVQSFQLNQA